MGDIPPSSYEPTLEQQLLSLGRMLKDHKESHQQQLASFLMTNTSLHKENETLRNATTTPRPSNTNVPRSLKWFESTDHFSPSHHQDYPLVNNPQVIGSPSHRRGLDPTLRSLGDMSSSPFVPAILNKDAPSHFALPKFQMYDGLQDPFDHLMDFLQIMTLQTSNNALLCKVFPSSLVGPVLSWFHHLAPNTVTSFRNLSEKFVTQYMCSVKRK